MKAVVLLLFWLAAAAATPQVKSDWDFRGEWIFLACSRKEILIPCVSRPPTYPHFTQIDFEEENLSPLHLTGVSSYSEVQFVANNVTAPERRVCECMGDPHVLTFDDKIVERMPPGWIISQ